MQAAVVAADEKEGGVRATLNLGHTFGHAIETSSGYGTLLHGEAVSIGTLMAADMSYRLVRLRQAGGRGRGEQVQGQWRGTNLLPTAWFRCTSVHATPVSSGCSNRALSP